MKLTRRALAMLCLSLVICSGCKKDEARHYDLLPPDPEDVTSTATLSVNFDNSGGPTAGEGSPKVIDGDLDSKFLNNYNPALYIQLAFRKAQCVTTYTLTSANDAPTRDPKNWTITASNDGENWVTLDTQTDQTFNSERRKTLTYEFENGTAYTYYRINITANGGSSLFQLAEFRVIAIPLLDQ
ncbi:discoidin domain-containing protein [Mucilaginibacter sp. UR6-1]|uniref:discoidin domain-containing protein n=1 Tax=Mucilaginibacter sp. UR6-1 TaxID=1435643 RepID=UPI001E5ACB8C|nr:discoidin domain-containing protein [Mucilaginibacter sp. UR6-1]MCC8408545.1 discoidin domain-containing protein [Mucilaginibacter sp. UR6-1]